MLSSNWHITLRLTFSRYSQSHGQNLGPKFWTYGIPNGYRPKRREDLSGTDMYHHAKFHADRCHGAIIAAISVTGQRKNSKLTTLWRLTSECTTEIRSTDRGATSTEVPSVQRFLSSRHSWAPRTSCSIVRCAHRASYHVSPADCSAGCSPCSTQRSTRTRSLRGCAAGTTCHSWRWSGTRAPGCHQHTYSWYSVLDTGRSGPQCNPDPFVYHGIL